MQPAGHSNPPADGPSVRHLAPPDALAGPAAPRLGALMERYQYWLHECLGQPDPSPELLAQATRMIRTVIGYEQGLAWRRQRERALRIRETEHQLAHCQRALDQVIREAAERAAATQLTPAEKIALIRREAFRDVAELEAAGTVELPAD